MRAAIPLVHLRWRCSRCRSLHVDFVCMGRSALHVVPWRAHSERGI
jgi:hypothetical protein